MKTVKFLILLSTLAFGFSASAQEITVVDVRRNITLSEDDIVYKDFYLNAGEGSSLKKNLVVNVKRKINVRDSGTKNIGDFETTVGQLKIIHLGNKVAVAREFKLLSRDEEPMLEQIGIMSGDRIDTAGSFIDTSKPNYKRKTAEIEPVTAPETKTADSVVSPEVVSAPAVVTPNPAPEERREPATATPVPAEAAPAPVKASIPLPQI